MTLEQLLIGGKIPVSLEVSVFMVILSVALGWYHYATPIIK